VPDVLALINQPPATLMRLAIFCALRWECRAVLRALPQARKQSDGRWKTWTAQTADSSVVLVQTGIGMQLAGQAAASVAASGHFDLFLSAGCAGALAPELGPGDLVVASTIVGPSMRLGTDGAFNDRARQVCKDRNLPIYSGGVLTSPIVLATIAARREAVQASGAIAVEMEAAPIASVAAEHGIPFGEIRAILDSADIELHESGDFMDPESGRVRPLDLLRFVATNPSAAPGLLSLRRMMTAAERTLREFFSAYLH
jgi:adenosylhomocysteine nucleosidase